LKESLLSGPKRASDLFYIGSDARRGGYMYICR